MKRTHTAVTIVLLLMVGIASAQAQEKEKLYDPSLDGMQQIKTAEQQAKTEGKFVLVQLGGNWCPWCIKLQNLCTTNTKIADMLAKNFVVIHVNYSKENRNEAVLRAFDGPQRFGFPVLLVIDGDGKLLHTQDTALLEANKAHDPEKVMRFLQMWTPEAVHGKSAGG